MHIGSFTELPRKVKRRGSCAGRKWRRSVLANRHPFSVELPFQPADLRVLLDHDFHKSVDPFPLAADDRFLFRVKPVHADYVGAAGWKEVEHAIEYGRSAEKDHSIFPHRGGLSKHSEPLCASLLRNLTVFSF